MPGPDALTVEALLRLPPLIIATIRWKTSVGQPSGPPCSGFAIHFEEHTPTQYRDAGGYAEPIPGTGIWKTLTGQSTCQGLPDDGDYRSVRLRFSGLHLTMFPDGSYRVTPTLSDNWKPSGIVAALTGYRTIEPPSYTVVLTKDDPIQSLHFDVVRRSWFTHKRLG